MKFGRREKKDLLFAGVIISLAFAVLLSGGFRVFSDFNSGVLFIFIASFLTAGIGFLLHEMMHKYVAQSYGLYAEFKAFYGMLWLALAFSFLGFIIAAPGAVFISGFMNKEKNGKISLAGPATNIVLSLIFLILLFIAGLMQIDSLFLFAGLGLRINALLAAFNMIPVMPFDGAKVMLWSRKAYWITLVIAIILFIVSFLI